MPNADGASDIRAPQNAQTTSLSAETTRASNLFAVLAFNS
jgi:hypothetical protein